MQIFLNFDLLLNYHKKYKKWKEIKLTGELRSQVDKVWNSFGLLFF